MSKAVTDGGFRADGTFVPLPPHDVTTLTEAFRRAVLRLFVRRELMDVETAQAMCSRGPPRPHALVLSLPSRLTPKTLF